MTFATRLRSAASRRLVRPFLPACWRLPYTYWESILVGSCEPELRHLPSFCRPGEAAIDVGANQGFYTYALSRLFKKVYAFEINKDVTVDLVNYRGNNIEIVHCGLSSSRAETTLYVPVERGIPFTGYGSLDPDNLPETSELHKTSVRVKPLDEFALQDISFMKIDIEGHEVEALKGSSRTIERWRPTILLEVKEKNIAEVDLYFSRRQYDAFTLQDLIGLQGSTENVIYLPSELSPERGKTRFQSRRCVPAPSPDPAPPYRSVRRETCWSSPRTADSWLRSPPPFSLLRR
jgi:FkbM family methyltransferase